MCLVITAGLIAAGGQSKPKTAKPVESKNVQFTCPDSLAADACKSLQELYKAGDARVHRQYGADTFSYVCFQERRDQFFIIELSRPDFPETHPATRATSFGFGDIRAFDHGVEDMTVMPTVFPFEGTWETPSSPMFRSTSSGADFSVPYVAADLGQITVSEQYKNRLGKNVDYRLVIQRSTGRFSESFTEESDPPISERNGRCLKLP